MQSKSQMLSELSAMLEDLFTARTEGATYARYARAHGYADGYMKALLDSGVCSKTELMQLVAKSREATYGPATAPISRPPEAVVAA